VDALIFAGGVGRRMRGSQRPKQFLELGGKPIIGYTIDRFARHPEVTHVIIACLESWIPYLQHYLDDTGYRKPVDIVPGGRTGSDSIFQGLEATRSRHPGDKDAVVLVHDGVRPLIDEKTISACIASVLARGCTATVAPATETVVVSDEQGRMREVFDRSECFFARAPQGFRLEELYAAHVRARDEGVDEFVDSISLMAHYGHAIYTVEGPIENIKVTTPSDYYAFKSYMDAKDLSGLWEDSE
jgi:2-C-methyl-D-erythritol 4-phosphate cytidylyltransferase